MSAAWCQAFQAGLLTTKALSADQREAYERLVERLPESFAEVKAASFAIASDDDGYAAAIDVVDAGLESVCHPVAAGICLSKLDSAWI